MDGERDVGRERGMEGGWEGGSEGEGCNINYVGVLLLRHAK